MILKQCTCECPWQDTMYGKGLRRMDALVNQQGEFTLYCTVCGKETTDSQKAVEKKEAP